MSKPKRALIVAAALAALPLAANAAVNIAFSYDPTVTIATNTAFTVGVSTTSIVANTITISPGDFFRFNVDVLVAGDPNTASGGAYDMSNGTTQPSNFGLTGFGFIFADSTPSSVIPRSVGGNAVIANLAPNNSNTFSYDVSSLGKVNLTTGEVGNSNVPISGGLLPGSVDPSDPNTYYKLTLGADISQPVFTGLTY